MKMQIYKLCFSIFLILLFSANIIAENIIVNSGEGNVEVVLDRDYVIENGKIVPLEDSNKQIDNQSNINQNKLEINSKEQPSQKESSPISGAVIGGASKNYILFVLMIFIAIISILIGLKIWKNKKSKSIKHKTTR